MAAAVSSPSSSSPRLPSPPPIAEDQIGPLSPGVSLYEDDGKLAGTVPTIDTGASRRIRPGTKAEDIQQGPPLVELQDIDSAFQLTEHLKALHYHHTHPPDSNSIDPITHDVARQLAKPPAGTSKEIWLYELGRFLIQKTNAIIVHLFADSPPCSPTTCPEMRASEWQYLCAVHDPPKSCAAIDYCCHTLDWAASALTSSKMFPSRLGLGSGHAGSGSDKVLAQQMKEITNIFRRVYRIYAHAWFQHRDMFWRVEGKTGLYVLFKTVCDEYGLIQPENYTISPEAEGHEPEEKDEKEESTQVPAILRRGSEDGPSTMQPAGNTIEATGNTTKRHTGGGHGHIRTQSTPLDFLKEEAEDEDHSAATRSSLHRSSTILHGSDDSVEDKPDSASTVPQAEAKENPDLDNSLSKRDTLKPEVAQKLENEPQVKQDEEEEEDDDNAGNVTTILAESEPEEAPKSDSNPEPEAETGDTAVDVKVEAIDPETSAAADPEEAGKTVAD